MPIIQYPDHPSRAYPCSSHPACATLARFCISIGHLPIGRGRQAEAWEFLWNQIKLADCFISHPVKAFVPQDVPTETSQSRISLFKPSSLRHISKILHIYRALTNRSRPHGSFCGIKSNLPIASSVTQSRRLCLKMCQQRSWVPHPSRAYPCSSHPACATLARFCISIGHLPIGRGGSFCGIKSNLPIASSVTQSRRLCLKMCQQRSWASLRI
jgi:hypothetical protein